MKTRKCLLFVRELSRLGVWFAALACVPAFAGGPLWISGGGNPRAWSTAAPVTINPDQGTLGMLSNAEADALTSQALTSWSSRVIATSAVDFVFGAELPVDNEGPAPLSTNAPQYGVNSDGLVAVIYDSDGSLTSAVFGAGAENDILGFAGPMAASGLTITDAQAVMNGRFIDGVNTSSNPEFSFSEYEGVIAHEIGHLLSLDHSQFNDSYVNNLDFTGYPTMYPFKHDDIASQEADDIAWITFLYPTPEAAANLTSIRGTTRNAAGALQDGVNVVARPLSDPRQAISCVSGYLSRGASRLTGTYLIPSLPLNEPYVLDFEQIPQSIFAFTSVGGEDPPVELLAVSPPEFINDAAFESDSDDVRISTTFFSPSTSGTTLSGVDLRLNPLPSPEVVAEVDNGATQATATPITPTPGVPLIVSGTIDPAETGDLNISGDDIEDWLRIAVPAGIEVQRFTFTPSNDQDIVIGRSDLTFTDSSFATTSNTAEVLDEYLSSDIYNGSDIFIGITVKEAQSPGTYTLRIDSAVSDNAALAIAGVSGTVPGTLTISGRNFSAAGGGPVVTFSDPAITSTGLTFISPTEIEVGTSAPGGFTNPVMIQVVNSTAGGSYGGRMSASLQTGAPETDLGIIVADSSDPVAAGMKFNYLYTVFNDGSNDAPLVSVSGLVPSEVSYVSVATSPSQGIYDDTLDFWDIGTLSASTTVTLELTVEAPATTTTITVSNEATVSGDVTDNVASNDTSTETTLINAVSRVSFWQVLGE
ncbi:MAG: hypothetical protein RLY93_14615 [Sumerlaeia bacterium]